MIKKYLLISLSLLGSLFIYLFYRTERTVVNKLAKELLSEPHYFTIREAVKNVLPLSSPVIYSLPEGLWVFSITLTSQAFFVQCGDRKFPCLILPIVFSIGLELFQLIGLTKGRFDLLDIAVSILFWMLALMLFTNRGDKQNLLKSVNMKSILCFLSYSIVYLAHVLD